MSTYLIPLLMILIVGFVTLFLKITIDRIFLVLLFMFWLGFDIQKAIIINGLVMLPASLLFIRANKEQLASIPKAKIATVASFAIVGGFLGRWWGYTMGSQTLTVILGAYAVVVGLRLLLLKPKPGNATLLSESGDPELIVDLSCSRISLPSPK